MTVIDGIERGFAPNGMSYQSSSSNCPSSRLTVSVLKYFDCSYHFINDV
jgi:hypothetical protein